MRKLAVVVLSVTCAITMSSCGVVSSVISGLLEPKKTFKEIVGERLSLDLSSAEVLEEWDTHGGFHGDGEAFLKLAVPDGFETKLSIEETVEGKVEEGWRALPLTGIAYAYYYEWGGLFEHPETGERVIPEIVNGYWYYTETGAMNWDLVILDVDENIFYFYEWDA